MPRYIHDTMQKLSAASVPAWHHKLLYAWCSQQPPPPSGRVLDAAALLDEHPDLWAEVQLVEKVGPRLVDALIGKPPLEHGARPTGARLDAPHAF